MSVVLFLYAAGITAAPCDVTVLGAHSLAFQCQNIVQTDASIPPHGTDEWTVLLNGVTYSHCTLAVQSGDLYAFVCDEIFRDGFE